MNQIERTVCIELKKWFNLFDIDCWLNFGDNKFTTTKSQKKPDLIIYSKRLKQYIALEVKPGDNSKDIHDASKIIEYWENYTNKNIEYFIDDKKIIISSFCVATLYSMFGKIFKEDNELVSGKLEFIEPRWEFRRTKDYLRGLWSSWRKKRKQESQSGLGIILANLLNSKDEPVETISQPIMFDMQWEEQIKPKWQNRQKVL